MLMKMTKYSFVRQIRGKEHILTFLASTYRFIAFRQLLYEAKKLFCGSVFRCVVFGCFDLSCTSRSIPIFVLFF